MRSARAARWVFLAILVAVAVLAYLFTASDKLASFGDDSASYLTLAQYFLGSSGNAYAAEWAPYHSRFPPLLPLLLAMSGGANDYRIAHALVAAMGVLSLPLVYRYAGRQLGSAAGGLAVVVLFLAVPTAWISLKGILSDPLFLLLTMGALAFFDERIAGGRGSVLDHFIFGLLLGCAFLTRVVGFALLLAYAIHCTVSIVRGRQSFRARLVLPVLAWVVLAGLWYALRPTAGTASYEDIARGQFGDWATYPLLLLHRAADTFLGGWVASFMGEAGVAAPTSLALVLLGCIALAGTVLRVVDNRLDGWFVLILLAAVFAWRFTPEDTRRLLYPEMPLLVLFAACGLSRIAVAASLAASRRAILFSTAAAIEIVLVLPALLVLASRAADREPVIPGAGYEYRDVTEYYTTINREEARKRAGVVVATLAGLDSIARATPRDARVMWMRPEYVALLGHRRAVPFLYGWDRRTLAAEIRKSGTTHVVVSFIYKTDLRGEVGDPMVDTSAYAHPVVRLLGGVFTLMRVDREALARFLDRGG